MNTGKNIWVLVIGIYTVYKMNVLDNISISVYMLDILE